MPAVPDLPFLRKVGIRNYKSIGKASVELGRLTILVGRNGSGKSNFLDALRFVADSLQTSLDHAIKSRGGIDAVRRRSTGHPRNFAISLDVVLPQWQAAEYTFEIASQERGYSVRKESLRVVSKGLLVGSYQVDSGRVQSSLRAKLPPAVADRLYLVTASGLPEFRPVYDALSAMGFYNLSPEAMKEVQIPDAGELLHRDGSNVASVVARLSADQPARLERIQSYLATIVPEITAVEKVSLGPSETLQFRQGVADFYAANMSDGTLRALGALVAVTQLAEGKERVRLVGIEEPETALHPAASGALMDALHEAAEHTQILVTTHSPDLLDRVDFETDTVLAVAMDARETWIAPIDRASAQAVKEHLYSPGELLRLDQLEPDRESLERQKQLD